MIKDKSLRDDEEGFERDKEEFFSLYGHMQAPEHREACQKLFDSSASELNASYRPNERAITPADIHAGLKWFFGHFSLSLDIKDEEAAILLNSTKDSRGIAKPDTHRRIFGVAARHS